MSLKELREALFFAFKKGKNTAHKESIAYFYTDGNESTEMEKKKHYMTEKNCCGGRKVRPIYSSFAIGLENSDHDYEN